VKTRITAPDAQRAFDFTPPRPRPFVSNLPARIDGYEEGVAKYFQWRTDLDYYATTDQIVDFVIGTHRTKVVDCLTDTATFALRLAGRKAFSGKVMSFDNNVTLLERARQRAIHLNLQQVVDFQPCDESQLPVGDASAEIAVSIFDLHRQPAEQFLREAWRILAPDGHLILAEMVEPKTARNRLNWWRKKLHLHYVKKNPAEAQGVYYDQEDLIQLFFAAGFRQVILQGLSAPKTRHCGFFTLVAATK
jgi:ubiquinone/menaquinone biosynthesis C-methylase UbiE